jgi:2-oxoglutarate ferredoxin oxidoreductase subunit alpha
VNSDEHKPNGASTEKSGEIIEMSNKRMRKLETLRENLPEPEYYGDKDAKTVFVGYGSVGNTVRDILTHYPNIGYLHYQYIYPLKYEKILELNNNGIKIVLIENNQTGEFGKLIKQESGFEVKERLLKYDGRPFFVEDILDYLEQ